MEGEDKRKISPDETIRTFTGDMSEVLENDREGIIKKIIHEQELREMENLNKSPASRTNKLFVLASLLLVTLAFAALYFLVINKKENTVEVNPPFTALINTESNAFLAIDGIKKDQILSNIFGKARNMPLKQGGIGSIYLTFDKQIVGLRDFIRFTENSFVFKEASFIDNNFMLGVVNQDVRYPFILIKMRALSDIFDSMIEWENKMFYDMHSLFGIVLDGDTKYLLTKDFENGIIANKNARILYDNENNVVLMYVYADDSSLVITNSPEAFKEIDLRIIASKLR